MWCERRQVVEGRSAERPSKLDCVGLHYALSCGGAWCITQSSTTAIAAMTSPTARWTCIATVSPWKRRIHGHAANHKPIARLSHSSVSMKLGIVTDDKRSPIEKIAMTLIAVPAIHDVCHPRSDVNPNIQGDRNRNTPKARLLISMKASVFLLSLNMVISFDEGHASDGDHNPVC